MERALYKELWKIRFDKMLALERRTMRSYRRLLDDVSGKPDKRALFRYLKELVRDETRHVSFVETLLEILDSEPV